MKPIPYESRYKIKWLPWFCICKIMVIRWTCPWKSNQIWMLLRTIIWWQVVTFDWSWPMTIWWLVRLDYLSKTMSVFKKNSLFTKTFVVVKRVFRPCFTKLWLLTDRQRVSQVLSWTLHLSAMLPTAFMRSKDSNGLKKKNCPFAMTSLIEILWFSCWGWINKSWKWSRWVQKGKEDVRESWTLNKWN